MPDLTNRVCLVTGASAGIGTETALGLARMGATVLLHVRSRERGERTIAEIRQRLGPAGESARLELFVADLARLADVRRLAEEVRQRHPALNVLVNNAGIVLSQRELTEDGLERTMAVNHFAPFLLTHLLLDTLQAGGTPGAAARVVTVSSDAHRAGRIDPDDLNYSRRFSAMRAYCDSKLANILFTYELACRLAGQRVSALCVHPGAVRTGWGEGMGGLMAIGWKLFSPFMISVERGALPSLNAATSPDLEGASGAYITHRGITRSSAASYNTDTARRLWEESARLTGVDSAALLT
jgi:NAD(P)-dependent dehydrogenase (short-subunit alcohol dehydrogenase family)